MAIDELPQRPIRGNRATFRALMEPWMAALDPWTTQANALADQANTDAANASADADAAAASAAIVSAAMDVTAYDTGKTGGYTTGDVVFGVVGVHAGFSYRALQDQAQGSVQALSASAYWRPLFYTAEVYADLGTLTGGTTDISLETATVFIATISTAANTFTFSDAFNGKADGFTLYLTNGGSQVVNWPSNVIWPGGDAPILTTSGEDILVFTTLDNGVTWYGFIPGLAMAAA